MTGFYSITTYLGGLVHLLGMSQTFVCSATNGATLGFDFLLYNTHL